MCVEHPFLQIRSQFYKTTINLQPLCFTELVVRYLIKYTKKLGISTRKGTIVDQKNKLE